MSRFFVLAVLAIVVSSEACIPLSRIPGCVNVPVSVSQEDYDWVERWFEFTKLFDNSNCPAFASQFYTRQHFLSYSCAGWSLNVESLKRCNPGKPLKICKRTCEKIIKERDEIAASVKCNDGKPFEKSLDNQCAFYTDSDCFDLEVSSSGTTPSGSPNSPDTKKGSDAQISGSPVTTGKSGNPAISDTKKGSDVKSAGNLLTAGMLAFIPIFLF